MRLPPSLGTLERRARGRRFDLPLAELFVPEGFAAPDDGVVPLFVHFQGGTTIARENFVRMRRSGVLIASTLAGLSSDFEKPYEDPAAFPALVAEGERILREASGRPGLRFGSITITFFSAGYGAVREILKQARLFERIQALFSADSIYADVVSPQVRSPRPEQMADFLRFAQAAARGERTFVLAHSANPTPYASTVETADALLLALGGRRERGDGTTERGVPIASRARVGSFHVYGFDEEGMSIHMDCLYMLPELVRRHLPEP